MMWFKKKVQAVTCVCMCRGEGLSLNPTLAGRPWLPHLWSREWCLPHIITEEMKRKKVSKISLAQCFALWRPTVMVASKTECYSVLRSAFCILQVRSCQFMGWLSVSHPIKGDRALSGFLSLSHLMPLGRCHPDVLTPHPRQFCLLYPPLQCFPLCQDHAFVTVHNDLIVQEQVSLQKDVLSSIYSASTYLRMVLCLQRLRLEHKVAFVCWDHSTIPPLTPALCKSQGIALCKAAWVCGRCHTVVKGHWD